jgi:hypothetical protein
MTKSHGIQAPCPNIAPSHAAHRSSRESSMHARTHARTHARRPDDVSHGFLLERINNFIDLKILSALKILNGPTARPSTATNLCHMSVTYVSHPCHT